MIVLSPYVTHRLADHWTEAEQFRPERFIEDLSIGMGGGRTAYFPFGAGAHMCIGNHLAMAEAVVALTEILAVADLRVVDPASVRPRIGATLGVAGRAPRPGRDDLVTYSGRKRGIGRAHGIPGGGHR